MNVPKALDAANTVVILIDFQERLFPAMFDKEKLLKNVLKLVQGAKVLEIPQIITEQYPKGLGPTLPEIKQLLPDAKPVEKVCFSCTDEASFNQALKSLKRKQVLVAGIEAHICVYQTAMALAREGYDVQVVADCVASRDPENMKTTLTKLGLAGILPTTTEMALFELLKAAQGDKFKQISSIIK
ncbi:MAG: hydrolase [Dehalococcoidales bacterium]|nr:hydrolase [Dehalococcoidales bacterium]